MPERTLAATVQAVTRHLLPGDQAAQLLLRVAELLLLNLLPASGEGAAPGIARTFHDFATDAAQMGRLFEAFVRNFLRRELPAVTVGSELLRWHRATATQPHALPLLPVMRTDTTLTTAARKLVIETKCGPAPLAGSRFAADRLLAPHLYQLLTYLHNQPGAAGQEVEGLLLYGMPLGSPGLQLEYTLAHFRVRVRTLSLVQPWPALYTELLTVVTT